MLKKLFFLLLMLPFLSHGQSGMDFQKMSIFITAISQPTENKVVAIGGNSVIYYSEDGGDTWHGGKNPVLSSNFTDISMATENIGWISGSAGVILKTTDGGLNWTQQGIGVTTLSIDAIWAVNENLVYASGGGGTGAANACFILKSVDGGASWTSILPAATPGISGAGSSGTVYWTSLRSLYFFDDSVGYAAGGLSSATLANGSGGKVLKTIDGGQSWNITTIASTNFSFRSITFASDSIGYACGNPMNSTTPNNFWKTTDAGTTWVLFNAYNAFLQKVRAANTNRVYVATGAGSVAVVRRTHDGGTTWTNDTLSTTTGTFTGLSIRDSIVYAGGGLALIQKFNSVSPAAGWVQKHIGTAGNPNDIYFTDTNNGFAASDGGKVAKTTNGGSTWTFVQAPTAALLQGIHFPSASVGYAVGGVGAPTVGVVVKTTDAGTTWSNQTIPASGLLYDVHFFDDNTGWLCGNTGMIQKTTDGGTTWVQQTSGLTTAIQAIYFTNNLDGWAVGSSGKIVRTTDGGVTWTLQTLPPPPPPAAQNPLTTTLYDVWFFDSNTGYISGGSGKVFKTTNGGTTWLELTTGVTVGNFNDMEWFDADRGIVSASGASTYSTHNGGLTWTKFTPYLTSGGVFSVASAPNGDNPRNVYIGHVNLISPTFTMVKTQLTRFYKDVDGDSYGSTPADLLSAPLAGGYVLNDDDCDDTDANIYPGATETCNTEDDDCDGTADEGVTSTFYADADGDAYGNAATTEEGCTASTGYVSDNTDCDDANAEVNPAMAEICTNTLDDNCNGDVSEGCPPLVFTYTLTHSCISAIGNSISVNGVFGGVMPFSYSKNGGTTYQNNATFGGLSAGTYNIMVKDANNTTASQMVTIGGLMTLSTSSTSPLCNAGSDGSVSVSVSGGYADYSYAWTRNNVAFGGNEAGFTNVASGTYKVTVTDDKGCTKSTSKTVTQPAALTVKGVRTLITCRDANDGAVNLTVSGGTPGYTYLWSDGATTEDRTGLAPGTYYCTATDNNGCTKASLAFTFTNPAALTVNISKNNIACFGETNGSATAAGVGGTGAKTYLWSTGATTATISNLAAGTYTVVVTDSKGCTVSGSATIVEPAQLAISGIISSPTGQNYTVVVSATGGTTPRKFRRTLPDGTWSLQNTTGVFPNVSAGTYTFEVKDAKNCVTTQVQAVPVTAKPGQTVVRTETTSELKMEVMPNPAKDVLQVRLTNAEAKGRLLVFSTLGKLVLEQEADLLPGENFKIDLAALAAGGYTLQFRADSGLSAEKRFVVVK